MSNIFSFWGENRECQYRELPHCNIAAHTTLNIPLTSAAMSRQRRCELEGRLDSLQKQLNRCCAEGPLYTELPGCCEVVLPGRLWA